jgi:hypothetical protein
MRSQNRKQDEESYMYELTDVNSIAGLFRLQFAASSPSVTLHGVRRTQTRAYLFDDNVIMA